MCVRERVSSKSARCCGTFLFSFKVKAIEEEESRHVRQCRGSSWHFPQLSALPFFLFPAWAGHDFVILGSGLTRWCRKGDLSKFNYSFQRVRTPLDWNVQHQSAQQTGVVCAIHHSTPTFCFSFGQTWRVYSSAIVPVWTVTIIKIIIATVGTMY